MSSKRSSMRASSLRPANPAIRAGSGLVAGRPAVPLTACGGGRRARRRADHAAASTAAAGVDQRGRGAIPDPGHVRPDPRRHRGCARSATRNGSTNSWIRRARRSRWVLPHLQQVVANGLPEGDLGQAHRRNAWLWFAANNRDQLRMRMAFALSEIFVVSDFESGQAQIPASPTTRTPLARNAFGSYRGVLKAVTCTRRWARISAMPATARRARTARSCRTKTTGAK